MIITLGENEFMAVGTGCRFTFRGKGKNEGKPWQYLVVEEGYYEDGEFQMTRILNGDQTDWGGPYIGAATRRTGEAPTSVPSPRCCASSSWRAEPSDTSGQNYASISHRAARDARMKFCETFA